MESKIGNAIKLNNQPVAVLKTSQPPVGALQFKEGSWGCAIAMLAAAAKGRTAVFSEKTTTCNGGKTGLGFQKFELGTIRIFSFYREKGRQRGRIL